MKRVLLAGFLLIVLGAASAAEPSSSAKSPMDRATEQEVVASATATGGAADAGMPAKSAMPDAPGATVLADPTTRQAYLTAMQRFYDYRANGYAYRSRVFEWQLLSSRIIFVIVLSLVAVGVYFAAVQFHVALAATRRTAARAKADAAPAQDDALRTQLEISAKGIVVNSSVLGVIILALSLAFFYLYLVYVYPISNVI